MALLSSSDDGHARLMALTPVAFNKDPAVAAMNPAVLHPNGMRTRRYNPRTGNPNVVRSIPAMVSRRPNVAGTRRDHAALHNGARRANVYDHLRGARTGNQRASQQGS